MYFICISLPCHFPPWTFVGQETHFSKIQSILMARAYFLVLNFLIKKLKNFFFNLKKKLINEVNWQNIFFLNSVASKKKNILILNIRIRFTTLNHMLKKDKFKIWNFRVASNDVGKMSTLKFRMLDSGLRFSGLWPGQVIALWFGLLLSTSRSRHNHK